jgi:uncharacterized protein
MNESPVQAFVEFVELDQRIYQLEQELSEGNTKMQAIQSLLVSLTQEYESAFRKLQELRKRLDLSELENKTLIVKLKEQQSKLGKAASPKEFFSLEHEIEDLTKKRGLIDDQGLNTLTELEQAQKLYELAKIASTEKTEQKKAEKEVLEQRLEHVAKLKKSYESEREKTRNIIAPDLLARYDEMKAKVANPVVPLLRNSCSGCFYAVSQPDLIRAQRGELVSCKDCYRFLYITQSSRTPHE